MSVESDGRAPADILAGASYVGLVVTGFFARGFELADFPNAVRIHRETKRAKFFRDLRFCRRKPSGAGIWLREDGEDGLAGLLDVVARRAHCKQLFRRRIESSGERRMSWRDEIKRNRTTIRTAKKRLSAGCIKFSWPGLPFHLVTVRIRTCGDCAAARRTRTYDPSSGSGVTG